jgi:hypothetical protein
VPPEPVPAETVTVIWVLPATPVGVAGVFGATGTVVVAWSLPPEIAAVDELLAHEPLVVEPLVPQ